MLATFAALLPLARLGIDPHHDGLLFKGALDVLAGQVPLRDSYGQYGALLPIIQAAFLGVFGPTLLVLKGSAVAFYALSAGLLLVIWRSVMPLALGCLVWAVWLLGQPEVTDTSSQYEFSGIFLAWSSVYALCTSLASCALLLWANTRSRATLWASVLGGVFAGLTLHLRTPTGGAVTAGLLLGLLLWTEVPLRRRMASGIAFLAGLAVSLAAVLVWLALVGGIHDWWQQLVEWPRKWAGEPGDAPLAFARAFVEERLLPIAPVVLAALAVVALTGMTAASISERRRVASPPASVLGLAAWIVATPTLWLFSWDWLSANVTIDYVLLAAVIVTGAVVLLIVVRAGAALIRTRTATPAPRGVIGPIALLALFSLASFVQIYPIPDSRHLYWAASPALGILAWAFYVASGRRPWIVIFAANTIFVPMVVTNVQRADERAARFSESVAHAPDRFAGMRVTNDFNARFGGLIGALEAQYRRTPDAPIIGSTRETLWLTLGENMSNADKYFLRWGGFPPVPPDFRRVGVAIWEQGALLLVQNWPGFEPRPSVRAYTKRLGYKVVYSADQSRAGVAPADFWLFAPRESVLPPPYRCAPPVAECTPSPTVPGVVFGP